MISETEAFFKFLLQQSKNCKFYELKLERWCGIPEEVINTYGFNRIESEEGWQIYCEDLARVLSDSASGQPA